MKYKWKSLVITIIALVVISTVFFIITATQSSPTTMKLYLPKGENGVSNYQNSNSKLTLVLLKNDMIFGYFGNDINNGSSLEIKDLPYLQVGPYHTNTVAGLELAMDILRRRKNPNKQIFMITDGKPTCLKIGKRYYKNSFGLDRKITSRCLNIAAQCKKLKIPITTFMIATDPYLQRFVNEFTETNNGKAFFAALDKLGAFIFKDFESGKRKTVY